MISKIICLLGLIMLLNACASHVPAKTAGLVQGVYAGELVLQEGNCGVSSFIEDITIGEELKLDPMPPIGGYVVISSKMIGETQLLVEYAFEDLSTATALLQITSETTFDLLYQINIEKDGQVCVETINLAYELA